MKPDQQAEQWLRECLYAAGLEESPKTGVILRKKPADGSFSVLYQQQFGGGDDAVLHRSLEWLCHHWLLRARGDYLLAVHSGDIAATGNLRTASFSPVPVFSHPLEGHSGTLLKGPNGRSLARKPLPGADAYLEALLKGVWFDLTGYVPLYAQERIILPLDTLYGWLDRLAGFLHQPEDCRKVASLAMHQETALHPAGLTCDPFAGAGAMLTAAAQEYLIALNKEGLLTDAAGKPLRNIRLRLNGQRLSADDKWGNPIPYLAQAGPGGYARKVLPEVQSVQEAVFRAKTRFYTRQACAVVPRLSDQILLRTRWELDLLSCLPYRYDLGLEQPWDLPVRFAVRVGNSFVSRFALNVSLTDMLEQQAARVGLYTSALRTYQREEDPIRKAEAGDMILDMQRNFRPVMRPNPADLQRLQLLRSERNDKSNPLLELSLNLAQRTQLNDRLAHLDHEIAQLEAQLQPESWFYDQAMEWRFAFPDALDAATADFRGFTTVITQFNDRLYEALLPPHTYLSSRFESYAYFGRNYLYVTELCYRLTQPEEGVAIVMLPAEWQESAAARAFRAWLSRIPVQVISVEGKTMLKLSKGN